MDGACVQFSERGGEEARGVTSLALRIGAWTTAGQDLQGAPLCHQLESCPGSLC